MQTLNGEKQALWKAWRRKNQSEWQTALECRAIGQHWNNIKAIIKARRKAGEQITVAQWSEANAPVTHRWLDEFSGFADLWRLSLGVLALEPVPLSPRTLSLGPRQFRPRAIGVSRSLPRHL